jgi:hypothetical protein
MISLGKKYPNGWMVALARWCLSRIAANDLAKFSPGRSGAWIKDQIERSQKNHLLGGKAALHQAVAAGYANASEMNENLDLMSLRAQSGHGLGEKSQAGTC